MSTTVRVSDETHARLVALADETGQRIHTLVENAVATYEATVFWEAFHAEYDRLAGDPDRWSEIQAERTGEASALPDQASGA